MQLPVNVFKQRMSAGEVQHGIFVAMVDPVAAEICAGAGFDWLMIDMEHAPNDLRSVLHQLQAMAASGVPVAVRPPQGDPVIIKRLLDIGLEPIGSTPAAFEATIKADLEKWGAGDPSGQHQARLIG